MQEMWWEDEMKFIASMEKEVMESCQTMGLDSNTALMVEWNWVWSPLKFSMIISTILLQPILQGYKEDYRVTVRKFKRKAGIQILPFQGIESQDLIWSQITLHTGSQPGQNLFIQTCIRHAPVSQSCLNCTLCREPGVKSHVCTLHWGV